MGIAHRERWHDHAAPDCFLQKECSKCLGRLAALVQGGIEQAARLAENLHEIGQPVTANDLLRLRPEKPTLSGGGPHYGPALIDLPWRHRRRQLVAFRPT